MDMALFFSPRGCRLDALLKDYSSSLAQHSWRCQTHNGQLKTKERNQRCCVLDPLHSSSRVKPGTHVTHNATRSMTDYFCFQTCSLQAQQTSLWGHKRFYATFSSCAVVLSPVNRLWYVKLVEFPFDIFVPSKNNNFWMERREWKKIRPMLKTTS